MKKKTQDIERRYHTVEGIVNRALAPLASMRRNMVAENGITLISDCKKYKLHVDLNYGDTLVTFTDTKSKKVRF